MANQRWRMKFYSAWNFFCQWNSSAGRLHTKTSSTKRLKMHHIFIILCCSFKHEFVEIKLFRRWTIFYSAIDVNKKKRAQTHTGKESDSHKPYKLLNESKTYMYVFVYPYFSPDFYCYYDYSLLCYCCYNIRAKKFFLFISFEFVWNVVFCIYFANYVRDTNNFAIWFGLVWFELRTFYCVDLSLESMHTLTHTYKRNKNRMNQTHFQRKEQA